jgi:hypothetical protein
MAGLTPPRRPTARPLPPRRRTARLPPLPVPIALAPPRVSRRRRRRSGVPGRARARSVGPRRLPPRDPELARTGRRPGWRSPASTPPVPGRSRPASRSRASRSRTSPAGPRVIASPGLAARGIPRGPLPSPAGIHPSFTPTRGRSPTSPATAGARSTPIRWAGVPTQGRRPVRCRPCRCPATRRRYRPRVRSRRPAPRPAGALEAGRGIRRSAVPVAAPRPWAPMAWTRPARPVAVPSPRAAAACLTDVACPGATCPVGAACLTEAACLAAMCPAAACLMEAACLVGAMFLVGLMVLVGAVLLVGAAPTRRAGVAPTGRPVARLPVRPPRSFRPATPRFRPCGPATRLRRVRPGTGDLSRAVPVIRSRVSRASGLSRVVPVIRSLASGLSRVVPVIRSRVSLASGVGRGIRRPPATARMGRAPATRSLNRSGRRRRRYHRPTSGGAGIPPALAARCPRCRTARRSDRATPAPPAGSVPARGRLAAIRAAAARTVTRSTAGRRPVAARWAALPTPGAAAATAHPNRGSAPATHPAVARPAPIRSATGPASTPVGCP